MAASATRAGGTHTSSMSMVIPGGRMAASSPCMPSRTRQSISMSSASRENRAALTGAAAGDRVAPAVGAQDRIGGLLQRARAPPAVSARNSMSSAAEVGGSSFHASGVPGML